MTLALADFLMARLAEDEARVRGDYPFVTWQQHMNSEREDFWNEPAPSGESWHTRDCGYGIGEMNNDCTCGVPARVLADVASKRSIVQEVSYMSLDMLTMGWVLMQLALPYAGHPDYREEWKP